jgi:hypothetical protein
MVCLEVTGRDAKSISAMEVNGGYTVCNGKSNISIKINCF